MINLNKKILMFALCVGLLNLSLLVAHSSEDGQVYQSDEQKTIASKNRAFYKKACAAGLTVFVILAMVVWWNKKSKTTAGHSSTPGSADHSTIPLCPIHEVVELSEPSGESGEVVDERPHLTCNEIFRLLRRERDSWKNQPFSKKVVELVNTYIKQETEAKHETTIIFRNIACLQFAIESIPGITPEDKAYYAKSLQGLSQKIQRDYNLRPCS